MSQPARSASATRRAWPAGQAALEVPQALSRAGDLERFHPARYVVQLLAFLARHAGAQSRIVSIRPTFPVLFPVLAPERPRMAGRKRLLRHNSPEVYSSRSAKPPQTALPIPRRSRFVQVQNEVNLESTQGSLPSEVKALSCESDGRKRSQSSAAVTRAAGVASGECGVASECGEIGDATTPITSDIGVAFNPKSAIQNPKSEGRAV